MKDIKNLVELVPSIVAGKSVLIPAIIATSAGFRVTGDMVEVPMPQEPAPIVPDYSNVSVLQWWPIIVNSDPSAKYWIHVESIPNINRLLVISKRYSEKAKQVGTHPVGWSFRVVGEEQGKPMFACVGTEYDGGDAPTEAQLTEARSEAVTASMAEGTDQSISHTVAKIATQLKPF